MRGRARVGAIEGLRIGAAHLYSIAAPDGTETGMGVDHDDTPAHTSAVDAAGLQQPSAGWLPTTWIVWQHTDRAFSDGHL